MALVYDVFTNRSVNKTRKTSGYATMVHGRGCNPYHSTTAFAKPEMTSLMRS